jgi:hypothetical protein
VLECMVQGLIPVVSEACGTDVDGCGVLVQPCTIEEIRHVVKRLSGLESGACREMSQRAYRAAVSRHSEERYTQDLASAIESIVGMQP